MSNVKAMHSHLVCPVTSCYTCPFRHVDTADLLADSTRYACHATVSPNNRRLFPENDDGKHPPPDWCPLRLQPVIVKFSLDDDHS